METAALTTKPENKKTPEVKERSANNAPVESEEVTHEAGVPLFLQRSVAASVPPPVANSDTSYVQRFCASCDDELDQPESAAVQTKLEIGEPDDEYEKEADAVAETVMRKPVDDFSDASVPLSKKNETPVLQTKLDESNKTENVPHKLSSTVHSPGSGKPLNNSLQSKIEPVLAADLSGVRVHTGIAAENASQSLNARAFTYQNNIFLGKGQSENDVQLMAHEAAHTVQQGGIKREVVQRIPLGGDFFRSDAQRRIEREVTRSEDAERVQTANSAWDISRITYFGSASVDRRFELIDIILDEYWVGPVDEYSLVRIWNSFGNNIDEVASTPERSEKWEQCIRRGMNPSLISATAPVRRNFESDVKEIAREYMNQNLAYAREEIARFGFRVEEGSLSPTHETEEALHLENTQELARAAEILLDAQDHLRATVVGYRYRMERGGGHCEAVFFDPGGQDALASQSCSMAFGILSQRAEHTWNDTNREWVRVTSALSQITAQSPTVYSAISQGRENVRSLGNEDPVEARRVAERVLVTLESNIIETLPKIDNGDLDWRDLSPIHQQLYTGRREGASGINWTSAFAKGVAQDVIGDHESAEFWISLGLGGASAALFIVASLATGGLAAAAFFAAGLAVSGGQALRSWENYEDLATAAESAASEETELISNGQVDAALFQAIIDSVFFFLDMAVPAFGAGRRALAAARLERALVARSAATALEAVSEGGEAAAHALKRGITELGVQETMQRTGKSLDEIEAIIRGAFGSDTERALLARIDAARRLGLDAVVESGETAIRTSGTIAENTWKGERSLSQVVRDIPSAITSQQISREFGDRLIAEAIERMGPASVLRESGGWATLAKALSDNSEAGTLLMSWRNAVFDDLELFVREELGGQIQRTGTAGSFSNDIDMSLVGRNASQVRQQAMQYLAARAGVENSPRAFDRIMLAGLFTDPTRIHAYDALPDAIRNTIAERQAAQQNQLIWNRRLYDALASGEDEMVEAIRDSMRQSGVPEFTYRPLTEGDVLRLSQRMDRLHGELLEAIERGNVEAQERIASQLSEGQALINAAEEGGYFSSGGVRRFVSERPGETPFSRIGGREAAEQGIPAVERLTAIVDQMPKLDHAFLDLASGEANQIVSGVRGIGKYGGRVLEVSQETGAVLSHNWERLVEQCASLKAAADSGEIASRLSAGEAELIVREVRSSFDEVIEQSSSVLSQLRVANQLPEIGNAVLQLQRMTRLHVRLLRATDWAMQNLNILVRAIRLGVTPSELHTESELPVNESENECREVEIIEENICMP